MKCNKCGSRRLVVRRDSRNVPNIYCADCDAFVKRAKNEEAAAIEADGVLPDDSPIYRPKADPNRPACKWCLEHYEMVAGVHVRMPIVQKFCPMCGRMTTEEEQDFLSMISK